MHRDLPPPLAAHPPVVKTCGFCSHWQVPVAESSAFPRGDTSMAEHGAKACAISGQSWRYLAATHRCHLFQG